MLSWPEKYARKGDDIRKRAIKEYKITPIFHSVLLPKQNKIGYFNQLITTNYYCFEFKLFNSTNNVGFFYCGDDAAKKWLTLIGKEPLPLFNPLSINNSLTNQNGGGIVSNSHDIKKTIHPIRKDLIVILKTLIALFDITNYSSAIPQVLQRILEDERQDQLPENRNIKAVNTILYRSIVFPNISPSYHDYIHMKELELNCTFRKINYGILNNIIDSFENTNPASF